jgi:NAD(P)-dependent dehydrogenase (short-subunit alcohol dehydrogenase family)
MSVYDLAGRKALVTGGARGLGEGMAQALARAGAAVVIGDIREDLGKGCADSLRQSGAAAEFVPLDITSEASWERAIPQAIDCLGGLDILVNNAGVEITSLLVDLDAEDARRMLECNVLGTALGMIEVRGLTKRYGEKVAVNDLTFGIEPGKVTGFLGPNGAGKTTTMERASGFARGGVHGTDRRQRRIPRRGS